MRFAAFAQLFERRALLGSEFSQFILSTLEHRLPQEELSKRDASKSALSETTLIALPCLAARGRPVGQKSVGSMMPCNSCDSFSSQIVGSKIQSSN